MIPCGSLTWKTFQACWSKAAHRRSRFLHADLVDTLLLYRAPILIGGGRQAIGDIGLPSLDAAWPLAPHRQAHVRKGCNGGLREG